MCHCAVPGETRLICTVLCTELLKTVNYQLFWQSKHSIDPHNSNFHQLEVVVATLQSLSLYRGSTVDSKR